MTPLPAVIRKGGFELTLVKRVGRVAIYRQHLPGGSPDHDAYEVIVPQVRHTNHKGETVEPYEGYPAAESWGKNGWTFTNASKAVQKLKQLAGKTSRAGTASRKNRLDVNGRVGGRSLLNSASCLVLASNDLAPGQRTKLPVLWWSWRQGFPLAVYSGIDNLAPNHYEHSNNDQYN
jgi:hypothetical protein